MFTIEAWSLRAPGFDIPVSQEMANAESVLGFEIEGVFLLLCGHRRSSGGIVPALKGELSMRFKLAIFGALVFFVSVSLSFYLLWIGKFTGGEFTAFVVSFAVLSLAVGFAPEIQEVSIAGNVVKLKEVKAEAIKAIESLNKSRIEMLRALLGLAIKPSGSFANSNEIDPRIPGFWRLIDLAVEYDCVTELKAEILNGVDVLLRGQISVIKQRNSNAQIQSWYGSGEIVDPIELTALALNAEEISPDRTKTSEQVREEIKIAVEHYMKLFELKRKVGV